MLVWMPVELIDRVLYMKVSFVWCDTPVGAQMMVFCPWTAAAVSSF